MTEEDENMFNNDTNTGISSETQAFEFEFIKTYERLPILWDPNHTDYTNKFRRCIAYDVLLKNMKKWNNNATRATVRQKINVLRSCYRKDLRKHLLSKVVGPRGEETYIYNPKNWKFYALRFLGGKVHEVESMENSSMVEINFDDSNFEDEAIDLLSNDEPSSNSNEVLHSSSEEQTFDISVQNQKINKDMKVELQDYYAKGALLEKEFEAIGSNVACKLKRMKPEQRYHAELLINKVLISGLKNSLTVDTDLTEAYK